MNELDILNGLKQELIEDTRKVLQVDTVKGVAEENAPFGKGNAECLDYVLNLCEKYGFKTENFDYYAGHADFGEGDKIFGVLGHLDVVPADEDGWLAPPFAADIIDGNIYARGALDDKSPMIAVLYAVRCLAKAGHKFKNKVRLIFGCDEESGMKCVKHYFTKVAPPDFAISPDANFPLINREKGIMQIVLNCGQLPKEIVSISGGSRPNVVMDKCTAVIDGKLLEKAKEKFSADAAVEFDGNTVITKGISAHASTPEMGKNAFWKMLEVLIYLFPDNEKIKIISDKLTDYNGKKWGMGLEDKESGKLTCNIGVVRYEDNILYVIVDCRHPITFNNATVYEAFVKNTDFAEISKISASEPLYVPEDSELVQKLLAAYTKATGKEGYTIAIGGGTYSRCMKNCVAFGPEWPGEVGVIHQPNERIAIDRLIDITKIYMEAIKSLCCE